jgi:hypothetical protein
MARLDVVHAQARVTVGAVADWLYWIDRSCRF